VQNALGGACVEEWSIAQGSGAKPLVAGEAEGILYGGCLSMLAASLARCTRFEPRAPSSSSKTSPPSLQIDRMLMQLKLAGKLNDVRGLVFAKCWIAAEVRIRITRWKSNSADRRRLAHSGGVRLRSGTSASQHHAAHRRSIAANR